MKDSTKPMRVGICAKCKDLCFTTVKDADGNLIAEHDGYVPDFMPGEHYGDYIELVIDVESGKILNWNPGGALKTFIEDNAV